MKETPFYLAFDDYFRTDEPFHDKKRNIHIGEGCVIRPYSFIYNNCKIGEKVLFGHNVMVREKTSIGNRVKIGTNAVIEGTCKIEDDVNIQSNVFIPINTYIESGVFIGPNVCFTNDKYPPSIDYKNLRGAYIKSNAVICANAIILPWVEIGKDTLIAAGSLVTKNSAR